MAGSEYGNSYLGREPVQYSVKMAEHLDSREILEAYRDPDVQPAEDVGRQGGRRTSGSGPGRSWPWRAGPATWSTGPAASTRAGSTPDSTTRPTRAP